MQTHNFEGRLAAQRKTQHLHARNPEKQNIKPSLHHRKRIHRGKIARRLLGPAKRRERQQRRRKPCVEHIGRLLEHRRGTGGPKLRARLGLAMGHNNLLVTVGLFVLITAASDNSPRRDPMAPPQLARDAPVLGVLEPAVPCGHMRALWDDLDCSVVDVGQGIAGKPLCVDEPLRHLARLDDVAAARADRDACCVFLGLDKMARLAEMLDDIDAGLDAVHICKMRPNDISAQCAVVIHDIDHGQIVADAALRVVRVVARSHLDHARAKLHLDQNRIAHDWNRLVGHRVDHMRIGRKMAVPRIVWMHRQCRVAENRFRARGRDHQCKGGIGHAILVPDGI
eukprot:comp22219_c0_seq1/m.52539 comp22219_c0_seq1/g.52539  ORF comp22219_c0_seq1/g.52539 comp22219_c0_seq1/m.52539 type:complete len:339 (+) comp22219_c0_seq1:1156-2172(+)